MEQVLHQGTSRVTHQGIQSRPSFHLCVVSCCGAVSARGFQGPRPCTHPEREEFSRASREVSRAVLPQTGTVPEICSRLDWPTVTHS